MSKSNETFYVVLSDAEKEPLEQITFDRFNKQAIEDSFNELVSKMSQEGQGVEYWKENKKYAYISLLTVEYRNGIPRRQIIKGNRVYYLEFNFFRK